MNFRLLLPGCLLLSGLLLTGLMPSPAAAQTITGQDDFGTGFSTFFNNPTGGNQTFLTRVLTPNNQFNTGYDDAPGTFGDSRSDYFGISDRRIHPDAADDSLSPPPDDPPDDFGFAAETGTAEDWGNFMVMSDLDNPDNPLGDSVMADWTFDVSGPYNIHRLSFDIVACGDFETTDTVVFSGGVSTSSTLFDFRLTEAQDDANIMYEVFMQSGTSYDMFFTRTGDGEDWDCLIANGPGLCPATGNTVNYHPDDDGNLITDDGIANNGFILEPRLSNPLNAERAYEVTDEDGTFEEIEREAYKDPLIEQGSGIQLDNTKKTFTKVFKETGTTLTLSMIATQNSSQEVIAIDNILVESALLGDANGDGVVDFVDVSPFLQALFDRAGYEATFGIDADFVLDISCDGVQDFVDVSPFLAILFP